MIAVNEWKDMVVPGRKSHLIARFTDQDLEFMGTGVVSSECQDPVFMTTGLVTMMIPWEVIEKLDPVEEEQPNPLQSPQPFLDYLPILGYAYEVPSIFFNYSVTCITSCYAMLCGYKYFIKRGLEFHFNPADPYKLSISC